MVKTRLVRIGNSQGIRIPKPLLEQTHLTDAVELEVSGGQLIVRAARPTRQGWDEQFQAMAQRGDDALLAGETLALTSWESDEWTW